MGKRARVFSIVQDEKHPITGESLLTEDRIKDALAHRSIKKFAYVKHDKDIYPDDSDEIRDKDTGAVISAKGEKYKAGDHKADHWHIVISTEKTPTDIESVAKWFGIPANFIDIPKGRDAFIDCVEYLTHEDEKQQRAGKHRYADEEIHANFDFRGELSEYQENRLKYGRNVSRRDIFRHRVLYEGMTIRQVVDTDPFAYQDDYATLDKFRYKYITERAPLPKNRINYYVCGKGGIGKGLICRAIARSLYPELKNDDDVFFEVGAKGSPFEGYDGQPVIIWNDRRAIDLLTELNGRGNVFNVFDTHPTRQRQNVKYSSINLCNEVNLVNSVEDYSVFLDGLAGEYKDKNGETHAVEDKAQSYRRFPIIIPLHEEDFDLLMNKGFFEGIPAYDQYTSYNHIRGNMKAIAERCAENEKLARELEARTVKPIIDKQQEAMQKLKHPEYTEDEIRAMFADYGTIAPEPSPIQFQFPNGVPDGFPPVPDGFPPLP